MTGLGPSIGERLTLGITLAMHAAWVVFALCVAMAGTWQYRLNGAPGETVTGYDELEQSLLVVLTTEQGSVPGRPLFGTVLRSFVDQPINVAGPLIVQEVLRALKANEPRVTVKGVLPYYDADAQAIVVEVTWVPTTPLDAANVARTTKLTLGGDVG